MQFQYTAVDGRGQEHRGSLQGDSQATVAAQMRARGLFPLEIVTGPAVAGAALAGAPKRRLLSPFVRSRDLSFFCRQLSLMLRSGLSLLDALKLLAAGASHPRLARAAAAMALDVARGQPLSQALAPHTCFPALTARLVKAAEAVGELDKAFSRVAEDVERRAALRAQLMASLLYPSVVILVAIGVVAFLIAKVLPKFARFLTRRAVQLPTSTRMLLELGEFLTAWGVYLGVGCALAGVGLFLFHRTPRGRALLQRLSLSLPVAGGILRYGLLAQIAGTLGTLLDSGLPLQESLQISGQASGHASYETSLQTASQRVLRGEPLAHALATQPLFPALMVQVVRVGEETGGLELVLRELAAFFDTQLQARIRTLTTLFEPVLLLVVGSVVGLVYHSFFQAVFQLAAR